MKVTIDEAKSSHESARPALGHDSQSLSLSTSMHINFIASTLTGFMNPPGAAALPATRLPLTRKLSTKGRIGTRLVELLSRL